MTSADPSVAPGLLELYPEGPQSVPEDLTRPTAAYRKHAWLALAGLGIFMVLYFALAGYFAWTTYRYLDAAIAGGSEALMGYLMALPSGFLTLFMLKALFFIERGGQSEDLEVTAEEEPRLFAFLHRLADEAGAPRPHRVFLSHRVNAAVFYDLSILNLIFPSRKNLEIGLGLVNALTLAELKAVLAHEFGHFAQRSMAVGRWVYIAQQIASHVVHKRDILDRALQGLSRIDLRVAWVAWLLRLVVWSIRSLAETAFTLVVLAQRALSREMELQADLVSVSLSGSDALVHALHRLGAADEALDSALELVGQEAAEGRAVEDLFAVQSRVLEHTRRILNDEAYGESPALPESDRATHRVFESPLAQPPRMWSTHPPSRDREDNAKRQYVEAALDDRPAWDLFHAPRDLRKRLTGQLLQRVARDAELAIAPAEQTLAQLDAHYARSYFSPEYRGVYMGRSITRTAERAEDLYHAEEASSRDSLYHEALGDELEALRNLSVELRTLEALQAGTLTTADGVVRHRDRELDRTELAGAIEEVRAEREAAQERLAAHDRRCRTYFRAAAAKLGEQAEARLVGIARLLHYAEHTQANLADARGLLANTVAVVIADGNVSRRERKRVVSDARELYGVLKQIHADAAQVTLDREVAERLKAATWPEALGELELPAPDDENVGQWLSVIDSWTGSALGALSTLRDATLEALLDAESAIDQGRTPDAGVSAQTPASYATLPPGTERKLQTRLGWWDRFQTADGFGPAALRLAVALLIVGSAVGLGGSLGNAEVMIYNGLGRSVDVEIAGTTRAVGPFGTTKMALPPRGSAVVVARTPSGDLIERFEADLPDGFERYVYNVAGAAPLVEWTTVYGSQKEQDVRMLGAPRWSRTDASILFREPPETIRTSGSGGTREVLMGLGDIAPASALEWIADQGEAERMVRAHALWDTSWDTRGPAFLQDWLLRAQELDDFEEILARRLELDPQDVTSLRLEQDVASPEERSSVCARHRALADARPESGDLQYVVTRCIDDDPTRSQMALAGHAKWPANPWFARAAGYAHVRKGRYDEALAAFEALLPDAEALDDGTAQEIARIRRLLAPDADAVDLSDLLARSPALANTLMAERGEVGDGWVRAYARLAAGELDEAVELAQSDPEQGARVLLLAAASDGASPKLMERALALEPTQGVDTLTAWIAAALAARAGRSIEPYREVLERASGGSAEDLARMVRFLDVAYLRGRASQAGRDAELPSPLQRGLALAAGTIVLGKDAPSEWRNQARRLLFATERPYFASTPAGSEVD